MQKPNPRGCFGNPWICLKCAQGQKSLKGLPCATHNTDRAQTSSNVSPTVELCPPHPTFGTKVRARRDVPEGRKIYIYIYKGSAWAPAFAGAHASGRARQHFDHLRCSCPIWHALNIKVMPRVSYEHTWDSESHALTKEKT